MGNIGYMFVSSLFPYYIISAGASGAIFGLAGALLIILLMKKKFFWAIIYSATCTFFFIYTIDPRINYIAHLFGFITGIITYLFCLFIYQHFVASNRFFV